MQVVGHPIVFGAAYSVYVRCSVHTQVPAAPRVTRGRNGLSSRRALRGRLCRAAIRSERPERRIEGKMSHYDGVDWIAMCLTFSAIYLLGNKSRIGFVVMMLGNLLWCIIGLRAQSYAMIIANLGFLSMNVRGFIKWAAVRL